MKKLFFVMTAFAAFTLTSCNKGKQEVQAAPGTAEEVVAAPEGAEQVAGALEKDLNSGKPETFKARIASIIEKINRPNAISAFMFVSDHGESISNGGAGHGGNCAATLQEYHVPYIFWWSDEYERTFPDKIANAIQRKSVRLNGDNIFYCLCDAADIELAEQYAKPQWSILSPLFEEHERLILVPDGKTCVHVDK